MSLLASIILPYMRYFGRVLVNIEYSKTIDHTQIYRLPPPAPQPQLRGLGVLKHSKRVKTKKFGLGKKEVRK